MKLAACDEAMEALTVSVGTVGINSKYVMVVTLLLKRRKRGVSIHWTGLLDLPFLPLKIIFMLCN